MNLEEYIKYDILTSIKDNNDAYMNNDNYFKKTKHYLQNICEEDIIIPLSYNLLKKY